MKALKELKWQMYFYPAVCVILGIVLFLMPETTATTLCYLIAASLVVVGVMTVLVYLFRDAKKNTYKNDFVTGLVEALIGICMFYKAELFISIVPFILGICVVVSGFMKLQSCIDVRRMNYGNGLAFFILAVINVVLGIVLIINPFQAMKLLMQILGVGLIFSGVSDFVSAAYMSRKIKAFVEDRQVLNNTVEDIVEEVAKEMDEE